jgi:hypothetical protein
MQDYQKLKRAPYMTKRMYIIKTICQNKEISLEYLFGLFNHYNNKNRGRWFWQKAAFTGPLKDSYDVFNKKVDQAVKEVKGQDENGFYEGIKSLNDCLEDMLAKMEMSLGVQRDEDKSYIEGQIDTNLKSLIKDGLRGLE